MRVLSHDPGLKPGYVELDGAGFMVRASHRLEPWVLETDWDLAVTERQWWFGGPPKRGGGGRQVDVNDILTLAFRAGFVLGNLVRARRRMALPPRVWRDESKLTKEQFQNQVITELTAHERKLFAPIPAGSHSDIIDSRSIGRAAIELAPTTTKWDWKLTVHH